MTKEKIIIDDKYWEKKYADMHIRLTNENSELREQLKRKEQALQEIKEIAEDAKTKVFVDMEEFWEQILQKCEVIDDLYLR